MGAIGPITHLGYTYETAYVRINPNFSGVQGSKLNGMVQVTVEMYPTKTVCQQGNRPLIPRWLEVVLVDTANKVRPDRVRDDGGTRVHLHAPDIVRFWGQTPVEPLISDLDWDAMVFFEQIYALISTLPQWENLVTDV